ncbi:hypothetical protein [Aurantiacibacter flavus]|uniref:Uncharacterized protein n=1 Tax=Aurantiacibacter flavus TaxID=3145232 RepID=A0ABV0D014_9SPHN
MTRRAGFRFALAAACFAMTGACVPQGEVVQPSAVAVPGQIGAVEGSANWPAIARQVAGAPDYTVYRPLELPDAPLPIVLWGNGGCSDNGMSASHFLREIASHGYLVIANGKPGEERPVLAELPPPPRLLRGLRRRSPSVPQTRPALPGCWPESISRWQ